MFRRRVTILYALFLVLSGGIGVRLLQLQVIEGERFRREALAPDLRRIALPAIRGAIRSREGEVLARDRNALTIHLVPSVFRDRSLVFAVADAWELLHPRASPGSAEEGASGESGDAVRRRVLLGPLGLARELLAIPARRAGDLRELRFRGARLVAPRGDLLRAPDEMPLRLRECLALIRGDGLRVLTRDLERIARSGGSLGDALGLAAETVASRLRAEVDALLVLGRDLGLDDWAAVSLQIDALLARERRWIDRRVQAQREDAICMDRLGTFRPSVATLGVAGYLEVVRAAAARYPSSELTHRRLAACAAIMGGGVPRPDLSGPDEPGPPIHLDPADRERLVEAYEVFDTRPARVAPSYCARVAASPDYEPERYLSERRERRLRHQFARYRSWRFGVGAPPRAAALIEGAGRLSELGFSIEPTFARERIREEIPSDLQLLVGRLSASRKAISGVEARLDATLAGRAGSAAVDADLETVNLEPARHGASVDLSISLDLQRALGEILDEPGAIAILDARSGAVLALRSYPTPPSLLLEEEESRRDALEAAKARLLAERPDGWKADYRALRDAVRESPTWHLAVENPGQCPPGSVFKAITLLVGLEQGKIDSRTRFECAVSHGSRFGCKGHGLVDVPRALEVSCNHFCYETGLLLGRVPLLEIYDLLGLAEPIPGLARREQGLRRLIARDDVRNLAIGQGNLSCVPVRVAGVAASLAMGRVVRPHLWRPPGFEALGPPLGRPETLALVREGMRRVVGPGGTARRTAGLAALRVAAKTGTAQLTDDADLPVNEAWFVGYAPAEDPRFAFAVLLHRTPKEGADAAPIALRALEICGELFGRWW
jgi:cell division protein FtsI/penicillin-binding protein 2